jgi:predicted nucleic acid-binding Zn ribbon protein
MPTKSRSASSLADALRQLLRSLGIETKVKQNLAAASWPKIVGEGVAKVSAVDRVENGILFVKVESSSWRNELVFMRRDIIKKMNSFLGDEVIVDIRFK